MYVCTEAHDGQRLERAGNMIIFFTAIYNSYYSYPDWYNYLHTVYSPDIQACYILGKKLIMKSA